MACETYPRTLADYALSLRDVRDDVWRLRIVLHEFGLWWQSEDAARRFDLVRDEPVALDERWDAFMGAYAEHLCWHERIPAPLWVYEDRRYLDYYWWPGDPWDFMKDAARAYAPACFEAHGVLIEDRELEVV